MTRSEQKLQKAIDMLKKHYAKAQANETVNKPLSYALYQTWREFDKKEKEKAIDDMAAEWAENNYYEHLEEVAGRRMNDT